MMIVPFHFLTPLIKQVRDTRIGKETIPRIPQVEVLGHGAVKDHEWIQGVTLKHGVTRFFRWHMDGALYEFDPSKVTALYGIKVPKGDELPIMFDILLAKLKSVAARAKVIYRTF
ncbi:hypothetical protein BDQ17DRAFT_1381952 [Cyathus striatus]|nr:hypothetical protein BDQ17DRAFT_1381952 [Cyathus striatus]